MSQSNYKHQAKTLGERTNNEAGYQARSRRPRSGGRYRNRTRTRKRSSSSSSGKSSGSNGDKTTATTTDTTTDTTTAPATLSKSSTPPGTIEVPEVIAVRDLANAMGTTPIEIIKILMGYGSMATINELIDFDTAVIVGEEMGIEVIQETIPEQEVKVGTEGPKTLRERLIEMEDDPEKLQSRPPVVTVLGHVDHGKTTLLDAIRDTNVVAGESGGITQHIASYQVTVDDRKITFLDTPGHAAFTAMRARGAQATDIAILVVAADDGVMPQTREAIAHVRAARVPIIVALNKIDKDNANPDNVKQQLTDQGLQPEDWGGETTVVPLSATQRLNIDELLENVLLVADVMDLKANPEGEAIGTVIEANQDRHLGNVATLLVQKGALNTGDSFVVGHVSGRVRALFNDLGRSVNSAPPATPVLVTGLQGLPAAGDIFQVVDNDRQARQIAQERSDKQRSMSVQRTTTLSLDDLYSQIQSGNVKDLNLIIKADVQGSLEPIVNSLEDLSNDEVRLRILHQDVGAITESDVMLAAASRALILGFHTRVDPIARRQADSQGVDIQLYDVIYQLVDDVSKALTGMLEPIFEERRIGVAEVRAVFKIRGRGKVLGCLVTDGEIRRDAAAKVIRNGKVIHSGRVSSLRRYQDDVQEIRMGYECGIGVEGFNDPREKDVIEAFEQVRIR
ncbi:MAG: translation initiation factor IF-2 [Chloroflexi bacterium]|nr:translation initiation factor IF-2 [Chloroflexota bacterium]